MEKYSDSLLDEKFKNIADKMDDHFEAHTRILVDIKNQTTLTNGRVNKLEGWQQWVMGGLTLFSIIVLPVMGWLGWEQIEDGKRFERLEAKLD